MKKYIITEDQLVELISEMYSSSIQEPILETAEIVGNRINFNINTERFASELERIVKKLEAELVVLDDDK